MTFEGVSVSLVERAKSFVRDCLFKRALSSLQEAVCSAARCPWLLAWMLAWMLA